MYIYIACPTAGMSDCETTPWQVFKFSRVFVIELLVLLIGTYVEARALTYGPAGAISAYNTRIKII